MNSVEESIASIVNRDLLTCGPGESISKCAKMMQKRGASSILIMENGQPMGIWTERDALRLDVSKLSILDKPIDQVMSAPVKTIFEDTSIGQAAIRFREEKLRHLLAVDAHATPVGIVTQTDVILRHGEEYYLTLKTVADTITMKPPMAKAKKSFQKALDHIQKAPQGAICVKFDDGTYGIVTEKDVTGFIAKRKFPETIGEAASRPLVTISAKANLLEARNMLVKSGFRHLGVHNDIGEIIGLISFSGILTSLQFEYVRRINTILEERSTALRQSQSNLHLAHRIIEASLDGVIIVNHKNEIEYVNPTFCEVTGYSVEEAIGQSPSLLKSGHHDERFYKDMWKLLEEDGYWQGEIWNRRKNGEIYPEYLTITAIKNDDGTSMQYAGIFCDITERKKQENEIRRLAYFDELTDLPNRRLFGDRLSVAIARAKRHNDKLAIMFVDLDQFKKINDTLGHNTGDIILTQAAERLKEATRDEDTVARMGGDEFVLIFPEIDHIDEVTKVARRIVKSFSQPFIIGGKELFVTASIGISIMPDDGDSAELLIKNADAAMYRSKEQGRSTYNLFNPSFTEQGMRMLQVESALRGAIRNDEFELYFQPQAASPDGRMIAAEALLRWHNDQIGPIGPGEFIPLAEEIGLISSIGEWVLDHACAQLKKWQDRGLGPVMIAINIAPEQVTDKRFPMLVEKVLRKYEVSPSSLEIEITEGTFIQNPDQVRTNLYALKQTGVHIAIDDFGTGYSNLSTLRNLPIDHLKIDQSFVRDMLEVDGNRQLVHSMINMGASLGMKSIAEGVETHQQVTVLREQGCHILQGYLFAKPEPADEFERHLLTKTFDIIN